MGGGECFGEAEANAVAEGFEAVEDGVALLGLVKGRCGCFRRGAG